MPAPIEVRKVPLHNVSDASELAKLIDEGVMEALKGISDQEYDTPAAVSKAVFN